MKTYEDCKCGSGKTYVSVSGDVCCYPCFKPLKEKIEPVVDMTARVVADGGGWAVKVNGVALKYFSKYEDYASTEAQEYAKQLNCNSNLTASYAAAQDN